MPGEGVLGEVAPGEDGTLGAAGQVRWLGQPEPVMPLRQKASLVALVLVALAVFVGAPVLALRSMGQGVAEGPDVVVVQPGGAGGWGLDARGSLELLSRHLGGEGGLAEQAAVVESMAVRPSVRPQLYALAESGGGCWVLDPDALDAGVTSAPEAACRP